jgi:hypothetical protein
MSANPERPAEWWKYTDAGLQQAGVALTARRRADYISQVEVVAEQWSRSGQAKEDRDSIMADLTGLWGLPRNEARELLSHAKLFRSERIREAARAGVLSRQHLLLIDKTLHETPAVDREKVEAALVENAAKFDGAAFRDIALRIRQLLDQDGTPPDDRELLEPRREFHLTSRRDGSVAFHGKIDQEAGAKLAALLSPLAKPKSGKDLRTAAERQGDAFVEIIDPAAASDDLPDEGGERPHIALVMTLADLAQQKGTADVEGGGTVDAATAVRIACDSKVMRVVLGAKSEILDIGTLDRTIPNPIRRALIIRDRGCAFPECGRRPRQCHAHHVQHWAKGGPTSLNNLVLLCGEHHRVMHHGHWTVKIKDKQPVFTHEISPAA